VFGVLVPVVFVWLETRAPFAASAKYRPLAGVAIGATLYGLGKWLHGNELLAAFTSGITLATWRPEFAEALRQLGAPIAETLKLATVLIFGVILSDHPPQPGWLGIAFAMAALLAARPLSLVLALLRSELSRREWLAAAWFGPKGFASLLYALLLLHAGLPRGDWLFDSMAVVIALSIVAHSSTDVAVARVFGEAEPDAAPESTRSEASESLPMPGRGAASTSPTSSGTRLASKTE
jgi:NhaP-type Na+/H+ or K+/H+ antiporter